MARLHTIEAAALHLNSLCLMQDATACGALNGWMANFLQSVSERISVGKPISTKQRDQIVRALRSYLTVLSPGHIQRPEIETLIRNPVCAQEPYNSESYPTEARYLGINMLALRFKPEPALLHAVKHELKGRFAPDQRVWVITVTEANNGMVGDLLLAHDFHYDEAVMSLLAEFDAYRPENSGFVTDDAHDVFLGVCGSLVAEWAATVVGGRLL